MRRELELKAQMIQILNLMNAQKKKVVLVTQMMMMVIVVFLIESTKMNEGITYGISQNIIMLHKDFQDFANIEKKNSSEINFHSKNMQEF